METLINTELKNVADWMRANRLALSIEKTNFILFHSNQNKVTQSFNIKINDAKIEQVNSVKYLGVLFDSHLNWKPHINHLCLKLSKTVGVLSKIRHFVSIDVLVMLYNAIVYPFLKYGIQAWGLTYPSFLTPVFKIQKKMYEDHDFFRTTLAF